MSAGGRSGGSRGSGRPGGWEEAGSEFYQESYPGADIDLDPFYKDPNYFTTLLPSKQNRATVKRPRGDTKATFKRRNSGYYSTMGNNTVPNEIHCAMMPDLSQNLATEESTWEEIMLIKSMPVNMAQKKEIKAKLMSAEIFRLQGFKQFKWRRRKFWEKLKVKKKEWSKKIDLWRSCIRTVRGNFGTGVATFFNFIKWLMFLNFLLTLIVGIFIFVPSLVFEKEYEGVCFPLNESASVACCKEKYFERWSNQTTTEWDLALGSGLLEHTPLLYGYYSSIFVSCCLDRFDMRIAYVGAWTVCLCFSLLWIFKNGFKRLKCRLVEKQGGCYKYCNLVFAGWDFCIYTERGKEGRHRAIRKQVLDWFDIDDDYEKRWGRSISRWCAKVVATGVVAAQGAILWFAFDTSFKSKYDGMWAVLLGYLPSASAALAHAVVPSFIKCLAPFSCLTRAAAPRLATLSALLGAFYYVAHCKPNFEKCDQPCPTCWETLFGQHVTRLIATELATLTVVTFLLDLPRSFCSRKSPFCSQEFDIPQHVCHLLYFQTLVFMASFHAPFLPSVGTLLFFFLFYLKKFTCLINSTPSSTLYWASRSKSLYSILTLISFFIAVIPWVYSLVSVVPSLSCGPYSGYKSVFIYLASFYSELPKWLQAVIRHIMSPMVTIPVLLILSLALYYFLVIARANQDLVIMLKKQLILEGHDKQFLLNRLSALIKQHQERHKPRSVDPQPPNTISS